MLFDDLALFCLQSAWALQRRLLNLLSLHYKLV